MKYKLLALGGTFDHLHKGHEAFILHAFTLADRVSIGITSKTLVREKMLATIVESYQIRRQAVMVLLERHHLLTRASFEKLEDIYGITTDNPNIEALLVTSATYDNARKINLERQKRGLKLLKIIHFNFVRGFDRRPISSEFIRIGRENREGYVFHLPKIGIGNRRISQELRIELKHPLGTLITGIEANFKIASQTLTRHAFWRQATMRIVVGDAATKSLCDIGILPDIAVIDFAIRRKKYFYNLSDLGFPDGSSMIRTRNPKGTVAQSLIGHLRRIIDEKVMNHPSAPSVICVIGEEDLATLPAILLAPLESVVVYGQPQKGLVVIRVTEEKKQDVIKILSRMN